VRGDSCARPVHSAFEDSRSGIQSAPPQALHRISGLADSRRLAERSLAQVFQFVAYRRTMPNRKARKRLNNLVAVL
jgi:hypothetical protein